MPWSLEASTIVAAGKLEGEDVVVRLRPDHWRSDRREHNIAGHPRDEIVLAADLGDDEVGKIENGAALLQQAEAAIRINQMAGAAQTILQLTLQYAQERAQFGRPLSRFQVIQHELAKLGSQVATLTVAADAAAEAAFDAQRALMLHAAKARSGEAAGSIASIAHQVHGAIGFADEHKLGLFTRALWSWRDEGGSHKLHCLAVGDAALEAGPERLWQMITAA